VLTLYATLMVCTVIFMAAACWIPAAFCGGMALYMALKSVSDLRRPIPQRRSTDRRRPA
jgi:hypothetical protein